MPKKPVRKTASKRNRLKTPAAKAAFEASQKAGIAPPVKLQELPAWAKFLTDREYLFVREYLVDFKAGKAALRAGIGNSPESAAAMASALRKMPHVAQAIDAAMAGSEGGSVRTRLMQELSVMAFHNPKDYLTASSRADLDELTDEQWLSVRKVKESTGKQDSFEVEGVDKLAAIEKMGKAVGLFKEDKQVTGVAVQVIIQSQDAGLL